MMNYNNFYDYNNNNVFWDNSNVLPTYKLDSKLGYMRGNMFEDLYNQYKNYSVSEIVSSTEEEALMNKIRQYRFAMIDLNLYLDTHPNDANVIKIFNSYQKLEKQACYEYESKYGPLTIDDIPNNINVWIWDNGPWPWEVK